MARIMDKSVKDENFNFTKAINYLFYVTNLLGLVPYSVMDFYRHKKLTISIFGIIQSAACLIAYVSIYHSIVSATYFDGKSFDSGTLTTIIGIFILYMEPVMMSIDMIATFINQRHLVRCIERLESIDQKLAKESITINYRPLQRLSIILIIITACRKYLMISFGLFAFEFNFFQMTSIFWPIFVSTLSKIWFVLIVSNIHEKFKAINSYLEGLGDTLKTLKAVASNAIENENDKVPMKMGEKSPTDRTNKPTKHIFNLGYLHSEIAARPKPRNFPVATKPNAIFVKPVDSNQNQFLTNATHFGSSQSPQRQLSSTCSDLLLAKDGFSIYDKFDKRLTNLCFVHDEICEVASIANYMFSFQMLMLMAYGFLAITAQLYFVYCGLAGQAIPRLFRSAENVGISTVLITSTAVNCVYVIYICWQTKNSAEKTGVFMHKVANVVDENHFYEIINHLSLKLLNHQLNFTACGFFDLDMATIYAITGAITSYLIILIQFNVAAQRSKRLFLASANSTNITANALDALIHK